MGTAGVEEQLLSKRGHRVLAVSPQGILLPVLHHTSAPLNPVGCLGLSLCALALVQDAEGRGEAHSSDCIYVQEI